MTVSGRLLADRGRGFRWWVLGAVAGIVATVGLWASVKGNPDFEHIVEDLPETVRA